MDVSFLLVLLEGKKISLVFLFLLILLVLYKHYLPPSSVHACMLSHFIMSNSLWPYGLQFSPGSSVQGIFQARILEWVAKPSSRRSSNPGIEPTSHVSCTGRRVLLPLVPPGESLSSVRSGQSLSRVQLFGVGPHESQNARPPYPSPTPGVHSNSCPSSQWCHPAISSSVVPFSSCPQSFPASESFPMTLQLFSSSHEVAIKRISIQIFFIYFLPFNWIWFAPNRASLSAFFLEGFLPLGWKWQGRRLIFSRLPIADFRWRVHTLHSSMRLKALQELDCILLMVQHSTLGCGRGGFHHQYTISRCVLSDWTCLTNYLNPSLINPKDRLDLELSVNYREVQY